MCELLGMNANVPTDIRFSFAGLTRRGGDTGPHRDGWGMAFYEGKGVRLFHDPEPSAHSEIAKLLRNYPITSRIVIAHVRRANRGKVALENTHPFTRELWGRAWTFAHNGQLKGIKKLPAGFYQPIGTTDSEHAFCWLLNELRSSFPVMPGARELDKAIASLCGSLSRLGVFNILMSESRTLYAWSNKRLVYLTRAAPFGTATLIDEDMKVDFSQLTQPTDRVSVVATAPLTRDEEWRKVDLEKLIVFRDGRAVT